MKLLEAGELLNAWEAGLNQPLLQKALILLAAASPGAASESLARMTVGRRDQCLLELREGLFGPRLENVAVCPECGERVEWENHTAEFLAPQAEREAAQDEFELQTGEFILRFRLPNSLDIDAVVDRAGSGDAERLLLSRCVLEARQSGSPCGFDSLPEEVLHELSEQLETLDPLADLRIGLHCPVCSHDWVVVFDIASFLWKEIDDWAGRMLRDVSELAAAYGWSEAEILGISPVRRQLYLGMLAR
jgi:hypothetical protein